MNKLGSAYAKAFEQSKKNISASHEGVSSGAVTANFDTQKNIDEGLASQQQILKMGATEPFSADELAEKRIIHSGMKDVNILNTFRNLRTKLLMLSGKSNFVTMVTSVVPGGGSSLVAANLASAFALDRGKTSLLIAANIQSPSLAKLLEVDNEMGLIDYLETKGVDLENVIHQTGIPRLRFLAGGNKRENSLEYFTSFRMRRLIEELLARYEDRYPIIDAPCILESADARILAQLCTQVILVVPYGMCSEKDIKKAARAIGKEKLAGIVLNRF